MVGKLSNILEGIKLFRAMIMEFTKFYANFRNVNEKNELLYMKIFDWDSCSRSDVTIRNGFMARKINFVLH